MKKEAVENWKPVVGWEGFYSVSDLGRVKSLGRTVRSPRGGLMTKKEIVLKPCPVGDGYFCVVLCRDRQRVRKYIHLLVLEAFVGPRPDGMWGVHDPNEDRSDNRAANLKWSKRDPWRNRHAMERDRQDPV